MNDKELDLINQRIDDMRVELKDDIKEIKELLTGHLALCQDQRTGFNKRVSSLEAFKNKALGIATSISLIMGLLIGKLM